MQWTPEHTYLTNILTLKLLHHAHVSAAICNYDEQDHACGQF